MLVVAEPAAPKRFEKSRGEPLLVHFHESVPHVVMRDYRRTIKRGGGVIEENERDADVIVVGRNNFHVRRRYMHDPTIQVVGLGWVRGTDNASANMPPPRPRRGPANAFDLTEEQHLALYLAQRLPDIKQGGRSGRNVYKELLVPEAAHMYPWACHYSAESWRARYKNNKAAMDAEIERIVKLNPSFLDSKLRMRFSRVERHRGKIHFDAPDEEEESSDNDVAEGKRPDANIEGPRDESPADDISSILTSPIPSKGKGKARAEDMLTQRTDATLVNPTQRGAFFSPDRRDNVWSPARQHGLGYPSTSQMRSPSGRSQAQAASPAPSWKDMSPVAGPSWESIPTRSFDQPRKAFPGPSRSMRPSSRAHAASSAPRRIVEDTEDEPPEESIASLDSDDQRTENALTRAKRRYDSVEQEVDLRIDNETWAKQAHAERQSRDVKPLNSTLAGPLYAPLQRTGVVQAQVSNRRKRYHGIQSAVTSGKMRSPTSFGRRSISRPEKPQFIESPSASVVTQSSTRSLSYNRLPARLQPFGGVGDVDVYARYDPPIAAVLRQFEQKYEFVPKEIIQQYDDSGQDLRETEEKLKRNRNTITSMDLDSDSSGPDSAVSSEHFTPALGTRAFRARQIMDALGS